MINNIIALSLVATVFLGSILIINNSHGEKQKDDDNDKKSNRSVKNWDGSIIDWDGMVERNRVCLEMERQGLFYPNDVDCISFPFTQQGEHIILDYIIQMAITGYYNPYK